MEMVGTYNITLVAASYLVAILASYCALYFAAQLSVVSGHKRYQWLLVGASSMGLGIWSMHFIGMGAYDMGMPMSYDLSMTVVSCFAAVLASALALYLISRTDLGWMTLAPGSLVMGAGIAIMHYLGMAAMKMTPAVSYEPVWFSISIVIAVGASAAAMAICRYTQTLAGRKAAAFQGAAALIMGAAICGMHYSGMAAVDFPQGSMPDPGNQLTGMALGVPVVIAAVVFMVISLMTVYTDIRARLDEEERMRREEEWVRNKAFFDDVTGLPNRSRLEQHLLQTLAGGQGSSRSLSVLMLEMSNIRELARHFSEPEMKQKLRSLAENIQSSLSDNNYLARYSNNRFCLVTESSQAKDVLQHVKDVFSGKNLSEITGLNIRWNAGYSHYPETAQSNRMLLKQALKTTRVDI